MKYNSLIIGLSVLALPSCTDNLIYAEPDNEVILTGNTYKAAFTENFSAEPTSSLNSGSRILLNASGSLQINSTVLTYIDNQWKAGNEFDWTDMAGNTNITALYPVYSDLAYTKENLYRNESLEDILYVKDEFSAGTPINLHFKHLFSLLTLHLDEKLQTDFQKIEVTCPVIVSSIEATAAQITLATNEVHTSSITQISSSGNYSFIVPPAENVTISIEIQTNGKKYSTQLQSKSFYGNQEYTYHLKTSEKTPGIVTPEDWIAFSRLINHNNITEYNGKTLNDFGETVNGVTTYYLLNDIDFKGVDCTNLEQIKDRSSKFKDIFDGKGHTISNFTPKTQNGTTGLFGVIDAVGIVKNLRLKSCNTTITKDCGTGAGILVGACYGTLTNCSVEDSNIESTTKSIIMGGLVGELRGGRITDCLVKHTNIFTITVGGGITGSSYGTILNCFSANNHIKGKDNSGGISGKSNTGLSTSIVNCYVYANTFLTAKSGLFFGVATASTVKQCFYFPQSALIGSGTSSTNNMVPENSLYNSDFTDESNIPIHQLLNQWIDEKAPKLYPDYTFTRWTDGGESLPAVFVTESQSKH